ncbi:MAG TPA: VOC family protein [Phenylobacterium sp.]|jgi:catechol 2,3-dioxygenase-like lactoylglutathione lyase family enzyme
MRDEINRLLSLYERREISRRGMIEAVAAVCVAAGAPGKASAEPSGAPLVNARTFNHVSLVTEDLAKSKAFYSRLTGLPVRSEAPGAFCEFRLENGFLGLYSQTFTARVGEKGAPPERPGFNHLCFGVEGFELKALETELKQAIPEAQPAVRYGSELYIHDPDGTKLQFADVNYKR